MDAPDHLSANSVHFLLIVLGQNNGRLLPPNDTIFVLFSFYCGSRANSLGPWIDDANIDSWHSDRRWVWQQSGPRTLIAKCGNHLNSF